MKLLNTSRKYFDTSVIKLKNFQSTFQFQLQSRVISLMQYLLINSVMLFEFIAYHPQFSFTSHLCFVSKIQSLHQDCTHVRTNLSFCSLSGERERERTFQLIVMCILLMAKLFLDGFPLVSPESVPSLTSNDFRQQSMSLMQENALHSIFAEKHYGHMWCHGYSM